MFKLDRTVMFALLHFTLYMLGKKFCMVNVLISYTKVSDKMAYAEMEELSDQGLLCLPLH